MYRKLTTFGEQQSWKNPTRSTLK
ncbi:MAG: CRISPR-associated protein Cas5 [Bryobacterales bacterium]|nr:CRISPR-associated protein Cas5 [Bryobacterales bacterium]